MLSWKFYWIYRSIYPKWFSRLHFMVNHVAVTPKYKAISKKFHITKSTNTVVVIFVFLKYKWVPDAPGDPPLHWVQGVRLHCISEPTGCLKSPCKQGKLVLLEETVITGTAGRGKRSGGYCFIGGGRLRAQSLGPNHSFIPVPLSSGARNERGKRSALPHPATGFHVTEGGDKVSAPQHYRQFGQDNCLGGEGLPCPL